MEDFKLYEKIEAYLKGQLTPDEIKTFENEIAQDADLAERVEMHKFEWDAMEVIIENDLRGKMAEWQAEAPPSVQETKKSPFSFLRGGRAMHGFYYALAAAASMTLLVAAAWWLWFKESPLVKIDKMVIMPNDSIKKAEESKPLINPPPQYPMPKNDENPFVKKENNKNESKEPPIPLVDDKTYIALATNAYEKSDVFSYQDEQSSRGDNAADTILDIAGKAFDKKDYTKAIELLKNTPATDENFTALEVLAHAYFQSKNYPAALPVFQNLQKLSGKKSQDKSEWYLLLCYLADYKKHKTAFDVLAQKILRQKALLFVQI